MRLLRGSRKGWIKYPGFEERFLKKEKYHIIKFHAEVAQLVEHSPEERRVGGSSPPLSTFNIFVIIWDFDSNELMVYRFFRRVR